MATPVTLRNASDAYVAEKKPRKNISKTRRLYLADGASANTRFAFIYFARPFPMKARILSATLRVSAGSGFDGSVSMTVQRTSSKWSVNRVNWRNKPGVTGPAVTTTMTNGSDKQWVFDVTAMMQSVADGAPWYGLRLSATGSGTKFIYSTQAIGSRRPVLQITWSDEPEPPEELYPDGGLAVMESHPTLRYDFTDNVGDTDMGGAQIIVSTTPDFSGQIWNRTYDTSVPEADTAALGFPGINDGQQLWWWVRVRDGAGSWSEWSESATFRRVDPGTVTLTNPPAGATSYVSEPTPPILWNFTLPQRAYQVIITDPEAPENWIWTSGKITSTEDGIEIPPGVITDTGATYRVIVRVWDAVERVATPGNTVYVEDVQDFGYEFDPTVQPVDDLIVTGDPVRNWATLQWSRGTAPDAFIVLRDGKVVASGLDPYEMTEGGIYSWVDKTPQPRQEHTWSVIAVVNGRSSAGNPSVDMLTRQVTTSLVEKDGSREVWFFNPNVAAERAEVSEVQYILGEAPPVLITQSIRGYEGSVTGILAHDVVPGLSAKQQHDNLEYFMRRQGTVLVLTWVDKTMEVVIRNVSIAPIARPNGTVEYTASFDFFQVDF